ncbi:hypothetical protein C8J56DRAFT_151183 [Mycena floridula]|nr:hypothetical protein C8J56DRAFT_151183 [Mycena floridula]
MTEEITPFVDSLPNDDVPETRSRPQPTTRPISRSIAKTPSSLPWSQDILKETVVHELQDTVFEHEDLLQAVYPVPVDAKLSKSIDEFVAAEPTKNRGFDTGPETPNYKPLILFLNEILALLPPNSRSYHTLLTFIASTLQVQGTPDGIADIKPDGVGVHRKSLHPLHWLSTEVAIEVNNNWAEMLVRAATYGRAMLEQCGRWCSVVLCFNHKQQAFRFCWYTRLGSFQTPAMRYTNQDELGQVVRGIIGLAACSRFNSGIDGFRDHNNGLFFALPLSLRSTSSPNSDWCIPGCATHVFRLKLITEHLNDEDQKALSSTVPIDAHLARLSMNITTNGKRTIRQALAQATDDWEPLAKSLNDAVHSVITSDQTLTSATLSRLQSLSPPVPEQISDVCLPKSSLSLSPRPSLIVKMFFPVIRPGEHPIEPKMLESVQGIHGVPPIISHKLVDHSTPMKVFTRHRPLKASDWAKVHSSPNAELKVEERHCLFVFFETGGESLKTVKEPIELVYVLVDSIIGHLDCFLKEFLCRDPSYGNILRLKVIEMRTTSDISKNAFAGDARFDFLAPHLKKCMGVIIDGELAVRLGVPRERAQHSSGTPAFMSLRLMSNWQANLLRTAIDDLESYIWVLAWGILCMIPEPTKKERSWIKAFSSGDYGILELGKDSMCQRFNRFSSRPEPISAEMRAVMPLLTYWMEISYAAAKELRKVLGEPQDEIDEETLDLGAEDLYRGKHDTEAQADPEKFQAELHDLCLKYYIKYLQVAVSFLERRKQYN